jgi:YHS domain-containing protein
VPCGIFALAAVLLGPLPAWAAVQWHADLATARAAARISQRPVLAVFTATWSPACSAIESTTLASDEAKALLVACFEPVRVDIDEHAEFTRNLGVTHVPTACVLGSDDAVVARFELTAAPAEFVAAAVRAAQAAAAAGERPAASGELSTLALVPRGEPDSAAGATRLALDGPEPEAGSPVTEKVRRLSQFASNAAPMPAVPVSSVAQMPLPNVAAPMTPQPVQQPVQQPMPQPIAEPAPQPMLPAAPPAWPALVAATPPERVPVGPRPSIEPSSAAAITEPTTPWLDAPLPGQMPPSQAAASATPPTPADLPPAASPAPATPPKPNAFIAALQKPFTIRNPFAAAAPSAIVPPPTMPPARSNSSADFAPPSTATATAPTPAAGRPEDPPDSMPLGLEGYCPVTLVERGIWTEGRAQWGARHRGRTYLFSGAQQQQAFLADPDRYAPALSGDDPVLALEGGRSTAGQRRYGVTYQARTYLFASPETRTTFAADPGRYAARVAVAEQPERIARR